MVRFSCWLLSFLPVHCTLSIGLLFFLVGREGAMRWNVCFSGSRVVEEGVKFQFELLMTKRLKEKTAQNDALRRSTILCLFPGRGEGGL
jgi:hypothetical protein